MFLRSWLDLVNSSCGLNAHTARHGSRLRKRKAGPHFQVAEVQVLEQRRLLSAGAGHPSSGAAAPTILTVTSLGDSGKDTLRDAILRADKGTAGKNYEIDITVAGTILLESQLPDVTNAITIKGLGTGKTLVERDLLAASFRILTVDAGQTAALSSLGIAQGDAGSGAGGAIDNFGNLTMTSCALSSNSADQAGAVANEAGASLIITGTSFTGNHSTDFNSFFGGGAIWNSGSLTLQGNASFNDNTAYRDGGAVFNLGDLTASNVSFTNNASLFGGGIYIDGGAATISGCRFSSNSSVFFGGAIENLATAAVNQSSFDGNSSANGGGIENWSGATLTVNAGTSFTGNSATSGGGGLNNSGTLAAIGASFTNNTSDVGGGLSSDGSVALSGCTFTGNQATDPNSNQGGGAIWNNGTLAVQGNSSFSGNTAKGDAAAIMNRGTANVAQTSFSNNTALGNAGAIENWYGANLTVKSATSFTGNSAVLAGGAINSRSTLSVNGASFDGNTAQYGGAIEAGGATTISGSTFGAMSANTATVDGGAIDNASGTLTVNTDTSFTGNGAVVGGAVYNGGTMTATGATFKGNTAFYGGAISNNDSATFSGCTFSGNRATSIFTEEGGGAIWNDGSLTIVGNSSFDSNAASDSSGGAIFNLAIATLTQASFKKGAAINGGAIANDSGATMTINPGAGFTSNSATNGGAIFNIGTLNVTGATFNSNMASAGGGAIDVEFGAVTAVASSLFSDNSAQFWGGTIFALGAVTVSGCTMQSNVALYGGALYVAGDADLAGVLTVSDCAMQSNTADYGGAIYNTGGVLTVSGSTIEFNTAHIAGGGIATLDGGKTFVVDSIVVSNPPGPDDTFTDNSSTLTWSNSIIGV